MVLRVDDAAAMAKLRASLKDADRKAKTAVTKTFNAVPEQTFRPALKDATYAKIPKRGGLAEIVATSKINVVRRFGGSRPSMLLKLTRAIQGGTIDLRSINRGRLRHPVRQRKAEMGSGRQVWVSQEIPAGFFDDATDAAGAETTRAMRLALHQAAADVGH